MKKLFLSLLFAFPLAAMAQPANPGFEEWFMMPGSFLNRPMNWVWSDGTTTDPEHWFRAFPEEDTPFGDYALTLLAYFDTKDMALQQTPVSGRPEHFTGSYRYYFNTIFAPDSSQVTDIAQVTVFLTHWDADSAKRDTVGFGILDLGASETYTTFDVPMTYLSQQNPDSAQIALDPSMLGRFPQVSFSQPNGTSSYFTVDNLSFDGGSLGTNELQAQALSVYPNPATDLVHFGDLAGTVTVRDASGRVFIGGQSVAPGAGISIANLPSGTYFLELSTTRTVFHSPIIKQ